MVEVHPTVEVPALPPLQPNTTSLDKNTMNLFGADNDKQDTVVKAPQTPTIGGNENQPLVNDDDINDKEDFTPYVITVR